MVTWLFIPKDDSELSSVDKAHGWYRASESRSDAVLTWTRADGSTGAAIANPAHITKGGTAALAEGVKGLLGDSRNLKVWVHVGGSASDLVTKKKIQAVVRKRLGGELDWLADRAVPYSVNAAGITQDTAVYIACEAFGNGMRLEENTEKLLAEGWIVGFRHCHFLEAVAELRAELFPVFLDMTGLGQVETAPERTAYAREIARCLGDDTEGLRPDDSNEKRDLKWTVRLRDLANAAAFEAKDRGEPEAPAEKVWLDLAESFATLWDPVVGPLLNDIESVVARLVASNDLQRSFCEWYLTFEAMAPGEST